MTSFIVHFINASFYALATVYYYPLEIELTMKIILHIVLNNKLSTLCILYP